MYYPRHTIQANGVSSGHRKNLYSDGVFDPGKLHRLIDTCKKAGIHTLLLSSEMFFEDIDKIRAACPKARIIVYLRHPLHHIESNYNQGIKRHKETREFIDQVKGIHFAKFKKLESFITQYGTENLIMRFYHSKCLYHQNLIHDFIKTLELPLQFPKQKLLINTSYSFTALEFKRRLNRYQTSRYADLQLDRLLQSYRGGSLQYSLMPPDQFHERTQKLLAKLTGFFTKYPVPGSECFVNAIKTEKPESYSSQKHMPPDIAKLADYIFRNDPGLFFYLGEILETASDKLAQAMKPPNKQNRQWEVHKFKWRESLYQLRSRFH